MTITPSAKTDKICVKKHRISKKIKRIMPAPKSILNNILNSNYNNLPETTNSLNANMQPQKKYCVQKPANKTKWTFQQNLILKLFIFDH